MYYVYVAGYILLAAAMQLFTGNFPVSFLAFPLNHLCSDLAFPVMDTI